MSTFAVVAEDIVTAFVNPNNGSGPLWCYGSPTLVREADQVLCSVPETVADTLPLCNTRWRLFRRLDGDGDKGFRLVRAGAKADEREPCPLARLPDGHILLSVNSALEHRETWSNGARSYRCEPHLLSFDVRALHQTPAPIKPVWDEAHLFTEHSYRGIAADRRTGAVLMLNIVGHDGQAWSYLDPDGRWSKQGLIRFPLRACYPQAALHGRTAHVMAVSDIVEPNESWRAYKREVTGNEWDYDFRQLYYTHTPDIAAGSFSPVLTAASVDETCGHIRNLDLWIGPDGDAHLLWLERNVWHAFMRDRFFPELPITIALKYCRVRNGQVTERQTLARCEEDRSVTAREGSAGLAPGAVPDVPVIGPRPTYAAFHAIDDERLYVVYHQDDAGDPGKAGNYIRQLLPELSAPARLDLRYPLSPFFTAGVRTGTEPSDTIDLFGMTAAEPNVIRYAQVKMGS